MGHCIIWANQTNVQCVLIYFLDCYFLANVPSIFTGFSNQGFGRENDGNRGNFLGSNLVIFSYKEFGNSRYVNLLTNRNPHLLFILSQSKAAMQK